MTNPYNLTERQIEDEFADRLATEVKHYGGMLPERVAIAWHGYFAACIEWGIVSIAGHERLSKMLPAVADDPSMMILLGREDPDP